MGTIIKKIILQMQGVFWPIEINSKEILDDLRYHGIENDKKNMRGDIAAVGNDMKSAVKSDK
jgi:hypothetical protein